MTSEIQGDSMTDTIGPQEESSVPDASDVGNIDKIDDSQNHRQGIFDEQFQLLMNGFGQACEDQQIEVALAVAKHPKLNEPIVFYRGHIIDAATLAAGVLRQIKQQIFEQLNTEPNR
jgi:hypothetical protein